VSSEARLPGQIPKLFLDVCPGQLPAIRKALAHGDSKAVAGARPQA
jgi:hypothetical protein